MKIGLISDTHGYLDEKVFNYFKDCDEIWHAGDFGTLELSDKLAAFKPFKGVYGNIDGTEIRVVHPKVLFFDCEGKKVLMTHIGGSPGKYVPEVKLLLQKHQPDIFICGHSHILRVMSDPQYNKMLYINPGAAGVHGFHKVKTIIRFEINQGVISNMQAIELGERARA
jgi:putative phosphoesterase